MSRVGERLRRQVHAAAGSLCEYCRMPDWAEPAPFPIDHIVALQHGGLTTFRNLALSCLYCNAHKGTNLASIDPDTERLTRLFHPREQQWAAHFQWDGPTLVGRTAVGRTTVFLLRINDAVNVRLRESLHAEGRW